MEPSDSHFERIRDHHVVDDFDCGNDDLNRWLHRHALKNDRDAVSRVFVMLVDETVVGYFALTMAAVLRSEPPQHLVKGPPGYPVGSVLLTKLAVAAELHGRGFGVRALAAATLQAWRGAAAVAARLIIVDAIDEEAARFYLRFGFENLTKDPFRLYARLDVAYESMIAAGFDPRALGF